MGFIAQQRNPISINAMDYSNGFIPDGTHDFTTILQAALNAAHSNGGGTVDVPFFGNGNYVISAPLVIYSNTLLRSAPGVTYTLAANSNCNMIKNFAVTPQRSVTDAAITTGTTTLTSNTANFTSADVGRTVGVTNAWTGNHILIANIVSITNSTTVTLSVAASNTVSGAACSIWNRDTNIEIAGGYWQRGNNGYLGGTTSSPNYQTSQFRHIDGINIHDNTVACSQKAYQWSVADVTNVTVKNITSVCPNTIVNTDVINIHGPAQWVLIDNIYGTNGDDFISIHSIDGDGNLQDSIGNITDLMVTNLFPNNVGQAAFKAHAGSSTLIRSLTVKGVHGSAQSGAIHLQDYVGPPSDNNIGDVLIEDVDCVCTNAGLVNIYCNNPTGTIILKDLVWRAASSGVSVVDVKAGNSLRNLIIDGMQIEAGTANYGVLVEGPITNVTLLNVNAPDTSVQFNSVIQVQSSSGVNTVIVRNVNAFMQANSQNTVVSNKGGSVKTFVLDNIYMNNGGIPFVTKNGSSQCQVLMSNITLDSAYQLAQLQGCAADFAITNLNIYTTNQSALIALTSAGANLSIRGRGLINPNNKSAFSRDGTQTVRIVHPEMQADVATLQNNNGDECYNTNSASATIGRCIANGTSWIPSTPPAPFVLSDPTALSGGAGVLAAGAAYFFGYTLLTQVTVTQMRTWFSGSPTGNCDMGIYDATGTNGAPGNLLGHTGANAAAGGVFTKSLGSNLVLPPGQYWLALVDTVADSVATRSTSGAGMGPYYRTSATNLTVLPSTAGTVNTIALAVSFEALLLNSFS